MPAEVTRFAPSPTGDLHLGHAYAALFAADAARDSGGRFLVRIEDIDAARSRPRFESAIFEDLRWLGLSWEEPVHRQSANLPAYTAALEKLKRRALVYPCFCTRSAIAQEIQASASAPHGPDGPLYPGVCAALSPAERAARIDAGMPHAWRLDSARAAAGEALFFEETGDAPGLELGQVRARPQIFGDAVLARRDTPASYHLCVVVDDAAQGVTLVTRGSDLQPATHLHRLLQHLLDLPVPRYRHHRLICDEAGRRLAKRDLSRALRTLREQGLDADDLRKLVGLTSR